MALIELSHICKTYRLGDVDLPVLRDVSLTIERGEFVALMGASGSGKTTLMNLLGCLDQATSGSYLFEDVEVTRLSPMQLAQLRGSRIGFVFQSFNLLPRVTALDNVRMPAAYSTEGCSHRQVQQRSAELLGTVGLAARLDHSPNTLSGGEQQRVAIARSLVNQPIMLLADEPTGNLDSRTGKEILQLFRRLNVEKGITLLLVTHDAEVARHADRVIRISDGQILEDSRGQTTSPEAAAEAHRHPARLHGRRARHTLRVAAGATRIAMQALRRNIMRTILTMLGVIIGVAAVIAMMEISHGASKAIQVTVINMGANTVAVIPGAPQRGAPRFGDKIDSLTPADAEAIVRECPAVACTAPIVHRARAGGLRQPQLESRLLDGQHGGLPHRAQLERSGVGTRLHRSRDPQWQQGLPHRHNARPRVVPRPQPGGRRDSREERPLPGDRRAQRQRRQPAGRRPGRYPPGALDDGQVPDQRRRIRRYADSRSRACPAGPLAGRAASRLAAHGPIRDHSADPGEGEIARHGCRGHPGNHPAASGPSPTR